MSAGVRKTVRGQRGFSLIELMVVVMIIGLLAALAVPSMSVALYDRNAYNDAGAIMQLFRSARTRAVARGAAELVAMSADGATTDRGTFTLWESVALDPGGSGVIRLPVPYCTTPTNWAPLSAANLGIVLIDGVNLNTGATSVEANADIETTMSFRQDPTHPSPVSIKQAYICYTPLGRSYVYYAGSVAQYMFDGAPPTVGVFQIDVSRGGSGTPIGTIRSVLLPPNGMARLFSHT